MVADDVGSSRRVGEEDAEALWVSQPHRNFLGSLEGNCGLARLLVLDECKLGEYFDILDDTVAGHDL